MTESIAHLVGWYKQSLLVYGYPLVVGFMLMESTLIPIPSEAIIPFAAYVAGTSGNLTVWGVVLAGTVGSWAGATIMYWASRIAGRPAVLRYGAYFLVPEPKLHAVERWSQRFGPAGVFVARLLPVVRHLIGIPMGIVKMDFMRYSLFTLAGSLLWCSVLAWVGVTAGNDPKLMQGNLHHVVMWLGGAVVVLGSLYSLVHRHITTDPKRL